MVILVLACSFLRSAILHLNIPISGGEILQRSLGVSLDRLAALDPPNGADLTMLVRELERL